MNKLDMMKIFVRVAETESFTKAAESLNMPKASISTYVQRLETLLGTQLLHRTTRKVTVTQDGMTFYERCKDLLSDMDDVETMFQSGEVSVSGRIRIDMPTSLAKNVVVPKLPEFFKLHPDIEIELSSTDRKVDLIREGFDCVVRVGTLTDSGLVAKRLGNYSMINCVSPAYIKKYGIPKKLEDLNKHLLVHYVSNFGSRPDGFEYFNGEKYTSLKMKGVITVNSIDAYTSACLAGLGIIQVPLVGAAMYLKDKSLVEVLPKLKAEPMPISLIYPQRRNMARRVRVFMEWLEEILKSYIK
ncbi:LysR family transcriptional regulator [Peredibacter starrii]|uniref:LysR family transcriptional regulator n=1 Tax=Peredibacter starrii TaxID=28202 RepID=A0AAX4HUV8_9BACT|nr:LysR family transcriptional regulator [Peredibacter starrii]WPU66766.1 LysR family transcriptional regulator [Peredibacter starrii]